ncbi:hypothetical protein PCAR4_170051 [Paraburkholderia caribensis]|nr:hypothetical protein PCAR4_170051 [Paraburkholderia caribensis]
MALAITRKNGMSLEHAYGNESRNFSRARTGLSVQRHLTIRMQKLKSDAPTISMIVGAKRIPIPL